MIRFALSGAAVASALVLASASYAAAETAPYVKGISAQQQLLWARGQGKTPSRALIDAMAAEEAAKPKAATRKAPTAAAKSAAAEPASATSGAKEASAKSATPAKAPIVEGRAATAGTLPAADRPTLVKDTGSRPDLRQLVARYAAAEGIPFSLAHGVVMVESRYKPRATGKGGYIGLMQLSYRTARGMGYTGSRAGLYDPETNIRYGVKYLAGAYRQSGGNTCVAVSKYQGGHGVKGVTRAGAAYCGKVKNFIAHMPSETKTQVAEASNNRS